MKVFPYVFIVLSTCLFNTTVAQVTIQKGTNSLSGNIAYYSNHANNENNGAFSNYTHSQNTNTSGFLGVSAGYFLRNNLSFNYGVWGNTFGSKYQVESHDVYGDINKATNSSTTYKVSVGAGLSKFWFISQTSFAFEWDASFRAGMGRQTQEYTYNSNTTTSPTTNIYSGALFLTPKVHYFISPKWSLNASLGNINYQYTLEHSIGNDNIVNKSNQLNASFGLSTFTLGLQFYY